MKNTYFIDQFCGCRQNKTFMQHPTYDCLETYFLQKYVVGLSMRKVNSIALQTRRRNNDKTLHVPSTDTVIFIFNFQTQNLHSNVGTFPYKCTLVPPVALQSLQMNSTVQEPHFGFPFLKTKTQNRSISS